MTVVNGSVTSQFPLFPRPYNQMSSEVSSRLTPLYDTGEPNAMEDLNSQLLSHMRGIWKYRWYPIAIMCIVCVAGWATVCTLPGDYRTTARVYVDTQSILEHDNNKDPTLVRDVVQSLLTMFVEGSFKSEKDDSQQAVQFINKQIKSEEERLLAAENLVKQFKLSTAGFLPRLGADYSARVAAAAQTRRAILAQICGDAPKGAGKLRTFNPELDLRIYAINKNLDMLRLQSTELHPDILAARRPCLYQHQFFRALPFRSAAFHSE